MNVYAAIATSPTSVPAIASNLAQRFPGKFMEAGDRLWFVADEGTTFSVSEKLGVKGKAGGEITSIVILPVTTYWGHANPAVWEWIKNQLEAKP